MNHALETITCSRCAGSGQYSYNAMSGSRCFKCHGVGKVYTRRGQAAKTFRDALATVPAANVKVGDLIWFDFYPFASFFSHITEIGQDERGNVVLRAVRKSNGEAVSYHHQPSTPVRRGLSAAEKAEHARVAFEYQETLTKAGTPRKAARQCK